MAKGFDSPEVKKAKAPTMFIELCDQRDSGWILQGTQGTKDEVRLKTPSAEFIPNRGFRLVKAKNPDTGEDEWQNEEIRYIKNRTVLSVSEQQRKGIFPAKNKLEDKIIIKGGNFSVTREGAYISLYDYLKDVFYNESNPNAPDSSKKIFRVVELGKKEEAINENKLAIAEATMFIGNLYTKQGNEYRYNEDKINALCQLFLVYAESPSGKINGLMAHAEKNPVVFLDKAMRLEQVAVMEIGHALELGVIKFDKNIAKYSNKDKVIANLGTGNMKQDTKIGRLADLFNTDEFKAAYDEFKAELGAAKDTQFKNQ